MSGSHDKLPKFFWVQLIAAAIIGVIWLFTPAPGGHGEAEADPTMANALKPIGKVAIAKPVEAAGEPRTGDEIVKKNCNVCHSIGLANAPKLDAGAKADWEARMAAGGLDGIVASAIKGKGGMPPRGGDPTLTDDEITAAIQTMLTGVGIETAEASEAKPVAAEPAAKVAEVKPAEEKPAAKVVEAKPVEAKVEEVAAKAKEVTKVEVAAVKTETVAKVKEVAVKAKEVAKAEVAEVKTEAVAKVKEVVAKPATAVKAVAATATAAVATKAAVKAKPAALVATKLGESTYKSSCFACHDSGVANSPKVGDKAVWAPRIAAGISALHTNAIKGKGAMPGKGGNPALSDQAVQEAVNFMVINSQ